MREFYLSRMVGMTNSIGYYSIFLEEKLNNNNNNKKWGLKFQLKDRNFNFFLICSSTINRVI